MAVLTIEVPEGASVAEEEKAAELGPTLVRADAPLEMLAESAGFEDIRGYDRTSEFTAACQRLLTERAVMEDQLRREEGDECFAEELEKKRGMLEGVRVGVLRRTLVTCRVPRGPARSPFERDE